MVLTSVIALSALGLVAAALLAVASKVFAVPEDPRVEKICETLPGANCGGWATPAVKAMPWPW